ncbi:MAG: hypothetical protein KDK91_32670, partial [Gammaproteobacteria bacterium]|nr:hypothetical protein [Gammaproteobacteria bacterium]
MKPLMAIALFWLLLGGSPTLARVEQQDRDLITQPVFMCGSGLHSAANSKTRIFESVPTRPLALSDDGTLLFVVNAPANCLEIYQTDKAELVLASTVSVGLDPVSVAQRSRHEVWVVNHVSDSVSIVDIAGRPRVIDTLQVGDAPWDVVFADRGIEPREPTVNRRNRAFISASFRGQHHPQFAVQHLLKNRVDNPAGDPGETIGRADLWVMDIDEHSGSISRAGIINLFTDSLRSLAVSKDGARVFATSFRSGNRTTTVPVPSEKLVGERWSADGMGHPEPMLIVQQDGQDRWRDLSGEDWSARVNYSIADNDLFIIDASSDLTLGTAARPRFNRHAVLDTVKGIGTILFNGVFDDQNDRFLVTALEANNVQPMQERLKGRFVKNQLVVVDLKAKSHPRIHKIELDADAFGSSAHPSGMALPGALAISDDGTDVLLASMGGNKLTRLRLSANAEHPPKASDVVQQFVGKPHRGVAEPVGGPIGVLADQGWRHVYVYTLFDNKLALFANTPEGLKKRDEHKMPNPETLPIQYGRQYLYDATLTSGNGSVACASCHIFGGTDRLQWDLSKKDAPIEHVHIGYVAHPDRDIPDLRTTIRAIALKADPTTATVGARVELGGKQLPVVFVGDKKSFADALDRQVIDLQAPGLVYLRPGPVDARLAKFHRIGEAGTWLLIDTPFFHPLKGPMLTLPLYGLSHSGPMH